MSAVVAVKEKPVRLYAHEVRAILDGRQSQLRRVMKPQPHAGTPGFLRWGSFGWCDDGKHAPQDYFRPHCPFGGPGDRLWVRETWASAKKDIVAYRADGEAGAFLGDGGGGRVWLHHGWIVEATTRDGKQIGLSRYGGRWRPSSHMPRWASRLTLEVVSVRVERVQAITEEDARAEGVTPFVHDPEGDCWTAQPPDRMYRAAFEFLWNELHGWVPDEAGLNAWGRNCWVWVVEFRRCRREP